MQKKVLLTKQKLSPFVLQQKNNRVFVFVTLFAPETRKIF